MHLGLTPLCGMSDKGPDELLPLSPGPTRRQSSAEAVSIFSIGCQEVAQSRHEVGVV